MSYLHTNRFSFDQIIFLSMRSGLQEIQDNRMLPDTNIQYEFGMTRYDTIRS